MFQNRQNTDLKIKYIFELQNQSKDFENVIVAPSIKSGLYGPKTKKIHFWYFRSLFGNCGLIFNSIQNFLIIRCLIT